MLRLLIVDDNEEITDILQEVAVDAGYEPMSVHQRAQVEGAYTEFQPDVIFLDLGLGSDGDFDNSDYGDGGLEVLKFLSAQGCDAKIIIISGMSRRKRELTQLQGQGLNLQVIGHLSKPFDVDKIEELLLRLRENA